MWPTMHTVHVLKFYEHLDVFKNTVYTLALAVSILGRGIVQQYLKNPHPQF